MTWARACGVIGTRSEKLKVRGTQAVRRDADTVAVSTLAPHRAHSERGFSLVELIVVLLITSIVMGIGIYGLRSARSSGQFVSLTATGQAYADAADEFARDHRGLYPAMPADWHDPVRKGPRAAVLGANGSYLRREPESVQDGSVVFAQAPRADRATLVYVTENRRRGYRIEIHVPGKPPCAIRGGMTQTTTPRTCSGR